MAATPPNMNSRHFNLISSLSPRELRVHGSNISACRANNPNACVSASGRPVTRPASAPVLRFTLWARLYTIRWSSQDAETETKARGGGKARRDDAWNGRNFQLAGRRRAPVRDAVPGHYSKLRADRFRLARRAERPPLSRFVHSVPGRAPVSRPRIVSCALAMAKLSVPISLSAPRLANRARFVLIPIEEPAR